MAPRTDRHRTRPITAPAPDADTTCGPRCATSMVARRLASPHRGRIYDCSRFDATPRRPRQHAALEERHADQGPCGGRGGMRATAAGGASSRASAAPPLRCGRAGDPPPAAVDRQLWPEARFRPGTDRHRSHAVRGVVGCRRRAVMTNSGGQRGGVHIRAVIGVPPALAVEPGAHS